MKKQYGILDTDTDQTIKGYTSFDEADETAAEWNQDEIARKCGDGTRYKVVEL